MGIFVTKTHSLGRDSGVYLCYQSHSRGRAKLGVRLFSLIAVVTLLQMNMTDDVQIAQTATVATVVTLAAVCVLYVCCLRFETAGIVTVTVTAVDLACTLCMVLAFVLVFA